MSEMSDFALYERNLYNFRNILELCKEATHWENLGLDIPLHAYQVGIVNANLLGYY
jgi:hypothetical protein